MSCLLGLSFDFLGQNQVCFDCAQPIFLLSRLCSIMNKMKVILAPFEIGEELCIRVCFFKFFLTTSIHLNRSSDASYKCFSVMIRIRLNFSKSYLTDKKDWFEVFDFFCLISSK